MAGSEPSIAQHACSQLTPDFVTLITAKRDKVNVAELIVVEVFL